MKTSYRVRIGRHDRIAIQADDPRHAILKAMAQTYPFGLISTRHIVGSIYEVTCNDFANAYKLGFKPVRVTVIPA